MLQVSNKLKAALYSNPIDIAVDRRFKDSFCKCNVPVSCTGHRVNYHWNGYFNFLKKKMFKKRNLKFGLIFI